MTKRELLVLRVVEYISQQGRVSRTQIAHSLRLSKATVTQITRQLIDHGIASEVAEPAADVSDRTTSGRPAVPIEINPETGLLIGIDLSGSRILGVVLNMALDAHARVEFDYPLLMRSVPPLDVVISAVDGIMTTLGPRGSQVRGIGISARALNYAVGETSPLSLMDPLLNDQLTHTLQSHYGIPVAVVHNMQALLVSEMMNRPSPDLSVLIHVGSGIGGAVWLDHKPLEGAHMAAGEWGHITVDPDGPSCACGKRGCLEALYAIPQLVERIHALDESLSAWSDIVQHPDRAAVQNVVREFAQVAAQVLANVVLVLDPEEIIVHGQICDVAEVFVPEFRRRLQQYLIPRIRSTLRIVTSTAGADAAARGAASWLIGAALAEIVGASPTSATAPL
ncbi:MAG: hypothetical protein C7B45_15960 [Sulfobacillus acidophilus]|uniref:HTH marR-type domain-containing protein n=1 Tax=Sulfobacillus acidophilus TaxID=53633 RepID=A0A2T2WDA1_9FIRM|nr:MAG: hypothetical protein C7B45_15960 [Sulfobacillus acidophilus]